uniref:Uncharacterized protein n=1 Tax=Eutreptiella gymnastica TaxID=73025 RepID=A0A7S4GHZ6_9EUGL
MYSDTSPLPDGMSPSPQYSPVQQYSPVPQATAQMVPAAPLHTPGQPKPMGLASGINISTSPASELSPVPGTPYSHSYGSSPPAGQSPGSSQPVSPAPSQGAQSQRSAGTVRSAMSKASVATSAATSQPDEKRAEVKYVCGDCSHETCINAGDPIRCHSCGHRILYKKRLQAIQQFQAI